MAKNSFDFDKYNKLMKDAGLGLKLHLGVQLIKDVVGSLEYFDNPLEAELRPIYVDLKQFHTLYKEKAAEESKKRENPSERNAEIDNSTIQQSEMKQMLTMFAQMQRELAQAKGENPEAAPKTGTNN